MLKVFKRTLGALLITSLLALPFSRASADDGKVKINGNATIVSKYISGGGGGVVTDKPSFQGTIDLTKDNLTGEVWGSYNLPGKDNFPGEETGSRMDEVDLAMRYDMPSDNFNTQLYGAVFLVPHVPVSGEVGVTFSTRKLPINLLAYIGQGVDRKEGEVGRIVRVSGSFPVFSSNKTTGTLEGSVTALNDYFGSNTGISHAQVGGSVSVPVTKKTNASIFAKYQFRVNGEKFPSAYDGPIFGASLNF